MISLRGTDESYEPIVKVTTEPIDKGLRIEVSDNGIGMDEETVRHAFEPLYTTKARGTGLGLSIVRKVAEEHGAKVFLHSHLNVGTTISVVLNEESLSD
jgi:signal transduction histidine kinase